MPGRRGFEAFPVHCIFFLFPLFLQPTAVTARTSLLLRALPNQLPLKTTHRSWRLPLRPNVTGDLPLRAINTTSRVMQTTHSTGITTEDRRGCTSGVSRCVRIQPIWFMLVSSLVLLVNLSFHFGSSQLIWRRWPAWRGSRFFRRNFRTSGITTSPSSLRSPLSTDDENAWRRRNEKVSQLFIAWNNK